MRHIKEIMIVAVCLMVLSFCVCTGFGIYFMYREGVYPTIATDLTDGETVNAAYRTFYVQAVDWYGNSLSSTALEVNGNGERLSSKGEPSPGILAYRLDLNEGSNTVDIKATRCV